MHKVLFPTFGYTLDGFFKTSQRDLNNLLTEHVESVILFYETQGVNSEGYMAIQSHIRFFIKCSQLLAAFASTTQQLKDELKLYASYQMALCRIEGFTSMLPFLISIPLSCQVLLETFVARWARKNPGAAKVILLELVALVCIDVFFIIFLSELSLQTPEKFSITELNVTCSREDVERCRDGQFLNDEVINTIIGLWQKDHPSCIITNTWFGSKFINNGSSDNMDKDLANKAKIFKNALKVFFLLPISLNINQFYSRTHCSRVG